ncbi:MAG TPA: hypothetical protein VFO95_09685 [Gemmatimonadales bacterium]|nr:hypothetical protein [Gemmatimonadales bacterium]
MLVAWLTTGLRLLAAAQTPVPSVTVSFGVDTAVVDVGPIVRLVRAYLARPDTSAGSRGLWASSNEWDRRHGDLHRQNTYQGFPASIIGVMSAGPGDSLYLVKVLFAAADSATRAVTPLALQRLYAVRAPGTEYGWQLSNALPRLTRAWVTRTEGRIRFYYAPGQPENPLRRVRAARFVDSVARLFGVAPPERLDYFVTASPDEYFRALGLDFFPLPSGPGTATGGNALARESIVLAGDPAQGEAYLHEITHVVLGGFSGGGPILGEGIAVWLGGSKGRSPREMYRLLAEWQRENPAVTLQALVSGEAGWGVRENDARYATGALFVEAVYRRNGASGLRALAGLPNETPALLAAMRAHLGLSSTDAGALEHWWRQAARERS